MIAPRMRLARVLPYSGILAISLILLMYIMLRVVNLMHCYMSSKGTHDIMTIR